MSTFELADPSYQTPLTNSLFVLASLTVTDSLIEELDASNIGENDAIYVYQGGFKRMKDTGRGGETFAYFFRPNCPIRLANGQNLGIADLEKLRTEGRLTFKLSESDSDLKITA